MTSKYRDLSVAELEAELRNAYMKKVLEFQIRDKERVLEFSKIRENYRLNMEKRRELEASREEEKRESRMRDMREQYKRDLEAQMSEKKREKKLADQEARRERKLLEEFDRIVEENELALKIERKRRMMEITSRDKLILEEMRKIRERVARENEEKMTRDVEKYEKELEKRVLEVKKLCQEQRERRDKLIERVAAILIDRQAEKSIEHDSRTRDMVAEEISWEIVIQERLEEMRRKKMREYLKKGLDEQIKFAAELSRRNDDLDKEFTENVIRRIMEDEQIEKLTNQAKIRNKMIYRQDLMQLMAQRETIRQNEKQRIDEELKRDQEIERIRNTRILEERRKILLEHAKNVGPYVRDDCLTEDERTVIAQSIVTPAL
ncbi:golgin subfamily A member 6-like protein 22 [Venturia canescens]|uniref:golgin subfamily A member 6-like protein 22 n=1 Tax=Venturia canescens TaxID=32260 RepID=UPI001C9C391B|nr:golgin subfamily A member 6-like protein 22 [Venturia canescens]